MVRPRPLFKERDTTRLLRAWIKAGLAPPTIRIMKATGDLVAIPSDSSAEAKDEASKNPWDEVLSHAAK
jgi:hypothetical protein